MLMVNAGFCWLQTEIYQRERGYIMTTMDMNMNTLQSILFNLIS
jgi:hypothetical protein